MPDDLVPMSTVTIPQDYRRKIKTTEEVRALIGPRPRQQSVIMCHGVFDLVHPGHVRHLMYAKSKAKVLIASLTSDAYISKAHFRPFVPQDLRAMNLAALEVVDYVIIDDNPTPIETIKLLQPDVFAKGYEYSRDGMHPRTKEELKVVESYGGEVLFTPGDIVYSSSALIEATPPKLSMEKLMALMESEGVTFDELRTALDACSGIRVHVVGDTIVDTYTYCSVISAMAKTPTLSVRFDRQVDFVGGAAIVAKHLREAGASVTFSTVLGDDPLSAFVLRDLEHHGVTCLPCVDPTRPTTQKNVLIASNHRLLKVDRLDHRPISDKIVDQLKAQLSSRQVDACICSDFRHGIFSTQTTPQLIAAMPSSALRAADSQVASRWGNILEFTDFDLITPNEREARFALGDQDSVIRPLAMSLYTKARCKTLILKLGDRGIMTYRAPAPDAGSFFTVDSFAQRVVDPVGAGDALLAYATLSLVATRSCVIASILGSMAAAVACGREGNVPVTVAEMRKTLDMVEEHAQYAYA